MPGHCSARVSRYLKNIFKEYIVFLTQESIYRMLTIASAYQNIAIREILYRDLLLVGDYANMRVHLMNTF